MACYEYFCMKLELFPEDIIEEYDLRNKVMQTKMSTVKSVVVCTDYHKQVSSRRNC